MPTACASLSCFVKRISLMSPVWIAYRERQLTPAAVAMRFNSGNVYGIRMRRVASVIGCSCSLVSVCMIV